MKVSFAMPTTFYYKDEPQLSWMQVQADRERYKRKMTLLLQPVLLSKLAHLAKCTRNDHTDCFKLK